MIKRTELLDALNRELVTLYPTSTVYRDVVPNQFSRPSFFLSLGTREVTDASLALLEIRQPLTIQCIDEVGERYEADTDRLSTIADTVETHFLCGYLRVADRALHLESIQVARDVDVYNVQCVLHYFDDRAPEPAPLPDMQSVNIHTKMEEIYHATTAD